MGELFSFYFRLHIKNGLASIKLQKQHYFHAVRMAERSNVAGVRFPAWENFSIFILLVISTYILKIDLQVTKTALLPCSQDGQAV